MKKTCVLVILLILSGNPVQADTIQSNDLRLDQERVAQEVDQETLDTPSLVAPLFSMKDEKRLKEKQKAQTEQLTRDQGQLFSSHKGVKGNQPEKGLFQTASLRRGTQSTENESHDDSLSPGLFYLLAIGTVLLLASWKTISIVQKKETDDNPEDAKRL